ncbi:hypothetical protein SFRURICE_017413, partial [Spodoptera frugiperda]
YPRAAHARAGPVKRLRAPKKQIGMSTVLPSYFGDEISTFGELNFSFWDISALLSNGQSILCCGSPLYNNIQRLNIFLCILLSRREGAGRDPSPPCTLQAVCQSICPI